MKTAMSEELPLDKQEFTSAFEFKVNTSDVDWDKKFKSVLG
jgi:hypothetical protein